MANEIELSELSSIQLLQVEAIQKLIPNLTPVAAFETLHGRIVMLRRDYVPAGYTQRFDAELMKGVINTGVRWIESRHYDGPLGKFSVLEIGV